MSRLSILSVLVVGLPLIGCAQAPSAATQTSAVPVADAQVTPVGSHIRGATPDPFTCNVSQGTIAAGPQETTGQALYYSNCQPFLDISHR